MDEILQWDKAVDNKTAEYQTVCGTIKSRDSSVSMATSSGLDYRVIGVRIPPRLGIFLFATASRLALGPTQPPIQWGTGVSFRGIKRPGRDADHSPPSGAKVKEYVKLYLESSIRLHGVALN
jgi:hypothetical protein